MSKRSGKKAEKEKEKAEERIEALYQEWFRANLQPPEENPQGEGV